MSEIHSRGATWISLHNGGGVGWGEVINGGFGMLIDGSDESARKIDSMLHWDVNNGVARRAWARNHGAIDAIKDAMNENSQLKVTIPNITDDAIFDDLLGDLMGRSVILDGNTLSPAEVIAIANGSAQLEVVSRFMGPDN